MKNLDSADLDENLAWLTQKTIDLKCNKGDLTFPTCTVSMIELESNKKWHFYINPSFFRFIPLSSKTFFIPPQLTRFLEDPAPL